MSANNDAPKDSAPTAQPKPPNPGWIANLTVIAVFGALVAYCSIDTSTPEQKAKREAAMQAWELTSRVNIGCENLVRHSSKFPSKARFPMFGSETRTIGSTIIVTGTVELMNGLGAMIPHSFICSYNTKTEDYDKPIITVGG